MPIIPYQTIPKASWCSQGPDNRFGLCFYAMCGNANVIRGKPRFPDAEIESAARAMEGFNEWIKATDRGENLPIGFQYIMDKGWPGDPTLTIRSFRQIGADRIRLTNQTRGCTHSWMALPFGPDPGTYDFTDAAVERHAPGVYDHAVIVVDQASDGALTFVTWAGLQTVSAAWADVYFQQYFDVEWVNLGATV